MPNQYKSGTKMIVVRLQEKLLQRLDNYVKKHGGNRQEMIRTLIRREIGYDEREEEKSKNGEIES